MCAFKCSSEPNIACFKLILHDKLLCVPWFFVDCIIGEQKTKNSRNKTRPSKALGIIIPSVDAMRRMGDRCGCLVYQVSELCWGSPAARRAYDHTLLCQEGHQVRRTRSLGEFKWRDGLGEEKT